MEKYQSYKPSRIQWINEIPSNWVEKKNKHIFIEKKDEVGLDWKNYQLLSLSKKGVIKRDIDSGKGKFPESFENYKKIECDDLIFCLYDIEETPRSVGLSNFSGMITGSYKVFKCKENPKFVYYWYLTIDDFKGLKPFYTGMRNVVRPETFLSLNIHLPNISEQLQIVQFLDEKTEVIDKLISTKERKISLLKEQRTSLINQVITKGLNPNVKMKDSGVEWIGEIPENWKVGKLKHHSELNISSVDKHIFDEEISVRVCNYTDVYYNEFISNNLELRIGSCTPEEFKRFLLEKGDVIITKDSESPSDIGVPSLVIDELENVVCGYHLSIIKSNLDSLIGEYLFRQLQTTRVRRYFEVNSNGITRFGLGKSSVLELPLILPPVKEQIEIIENLDSKTKEIDDLVLLEKKKIDLLKEYRQSLISEVVTGKIKVTN